MDPEQRFGPGLYSAVITTAVPGSYWLGGVQYTLDADASMRIENPVCIVYTQALAVPEPLAWMMLSMGLASLCALGRRRARAVG